MGLRLRAATVRGPGHLADGLPNQDAVLIRHGREIARQAGAMGADDIRRWTLNNLG